MESLALQGARVPFDGSNIDVTPSGAHRIVLKVRAADKTCQLTPVTNTLYGAAGPASFVNMSLCGTRVIARVTTNVRDECRARGLPKVLPAQITATVVDSADNTVAMGAVTCHLVPKGAVAKEDGKDGLKECDVPEESRSISESLIASTPSSPKKRRRVYVDMVARAGAAKRLFLDASHGGVSDNLN